MQTKNNVGNIYNKKRGQDALVFSIISAEEQLNAIQLYIKMRCLRRICAVLDIHKNSGEKKLVFTCSRHIKLIAYQSDGKKKQQILCNLQLYFFLFHQQCQAFEACITDEQMAGHTAKANKNSMQFSLCEQTMQHQFHRHAKNQYAFSLGTFSFSLLIFLLSFFLCFN